MAEKLESISTVKCFWCPKCHLSWKTNEYDVLDQNSEDYDDFTAQCPQCKNTVTSKPYYFANLSKMSANATGPRTKEGREIVAHNPIKHGLYSAPDKLFYPRKPGKYKECDSCGHRELCENKEIKHCIVKTDILLKFVYAYKTGDANMLRELAGFTQARVAMALNDVLADLQNHGVMLVAPKVNGFGEVLKDEEGNTIFDYSANPLLKHIPSLINTLGFSADQQEITPEKSREKDEVNNPGNLALKGTEVLNHIMSFFFGKNQVADNAESKRNEDPVYQSLTGREVSEEEIVVDTPAVNPFAEMS